ncbi:MAG: hypothetical protein GWP07_04955 [Xanthomonadaceae bacterium]|nr:hypothetical protein [Xanthomonadaceae bacterium]
MENKTKHLRRLLDREFRHENRQENSNTVSTLPLGEEKDEWRIFPVVRRCFLRGLSPERGDDYVA